MLSPIPFDRPTIDEEEIEAVTQVLLSGWVTTGPQARLFEERFAAFVGSRFALAVNSGTAALHLALAAAGIGPGDEVITTPLTFCATLHVITHLGARPVPVDVHPDDYNLDPRAVEAAVTPRTKAILPVHLAGIPCRMNELEAIAAQHDLFLFDDAAHALGASVGKRKIGSIGTATEFSFYATKNLTTAEGGMLTTDDEAFLKRARVLSLHGLTRDAWSRRDGDEAWRYDVILSGYKYNMADIQAALGLVQLKKLPHMLKRRAEIHSRYREAFEQLPALIPAPAAPAGSRSAHHLYMLRLRQEQLGINRNQFYRELQARGIGASVHFIPVYHLTYFKAHFDWQPADFPVAESIFQSTISLPCYPSLQEDEVTRIIQTVSDIATQSGR